MFRPIHEIIRCEDTEQELSDRWTGAQYRRNENAKADMAGRKRPFGKRGS